MDERLKSDLSDLQVKPQNELSKALPQNLAVVLDDLIFVQLYRNLPHQQKAEQLRPGGSWTNTGNWVCDHR